MQRDVDYIGLSYKTKTHSKVAAKKLKKIENDLKLFPVVEAKSISGIFDGLFIEVIDEIGKSSLYENGCFGSGFYSRGAPRSKNEPLMLNIEEAFYLAHVLEVLTITNTKEQLLDFSNFLTICLDIDEDFIENFAAYLYLKSKGWIVKSGANFGSKYSIYRTGPEYFHATFLVQVTKYSAAPKLDIKAVHIMQRVASTAKKDIIFLEVSRSDNSDIKSIEDFENVQISEMVICKFNFNQFLTKNDPNKITKKCE